MNKKRRYADTHTVSCAPRRHRQQTPPSTTASLSRSRRYIYPQQSTDPSIDPSTHQQLRGGYGLPFLFPKRSFFFSFAIFDQNLCAQNRSQPRTRPDVRRHNPSPARVDSTLNSAPGSMLPRSSSFPTANYLRLLPTILLQAKGAQSWSCKVSFLDPISSSSSGNAWDWESFLGMGALQASGAHLLRM